MATKEFFAKLFFTMIFLILLYYSGKTIFFYIVDKTFEEESVECEYIKNVNVGICNYVEVKKPKKPKTRQNSRIQEEKTSLKGMDFLLILFDYILKKGINTKYLKGNCFFSIL